MKNILKVLLCTFCFFSLFLNIKNSKKNIKLKSSKEKYYFLPIIGAAFFLIIIYFIELIMISCSKKYRLIYFLPLHLFTDKYPTYFFYLGLLQISGFFSQFISFFCSFIYCVYKSLFFSLLIILLSGFMSLTFHPEIIIFFNLYYCLIFIIDLLLEYSLMILMITKQLELSIYLKEAKDGFEFIFLFILSIISYFRRYRTFINNREFIRENILDEISHSFKAKQLKKFIIYTFIYTILRIIYSLFLIYYTLIKKKVDLMTLEKFLSTLGYLFDSIFYFIFLILTYPKPYPEGYLEEIMPLNNFNHQYNSSIKNTLSLENIPSNLLSEYQTNNYPIPIINPYSNNNESSAFNNIKIGYVTLIDN